MGVDELSDGQKERLEGLPLLRSFQGLSHILKETRDIYVDFKRKMDSSVLTIICLTMRPLLTKLIPLRREMTVAPTSSEMRRALIRSRKACTTSLVAALGRISKRMSL